MLLLFHGSAPPSLPAHINWPPSASCLSISSASSVHLDCGKQPRAAIPPKTLFAPSDLSSSKFHLLTFTNIHPSYGKTKGQHMALCCIRSHLQSKGDICWYREAESGYVILLKRVLFTSVSDFPGFSRFPWCKDAQFPVCLATVRHSDSSVTFAATLTFHLITMLWYDISQI